MNLTELNKKKLFWSASGLVFLTILFFYNAPADYSAIKVMLLLSTPFIVFLTYAVLGIIGVVVIGLSKMIRDWLFK